MTEVELPDFDSMFELASKISDLLKEKTLLENTIKAAEAEITKRAMTDPNLYINGKPPSMDFVKNAYLQSGFNGELLPLREELANAESEYKRFELIFKIYQDKIDIYRTESANQRRLTL